MKKLLLGSFCLLLFTSSILLFQASCSKSNAQMTNTNSQAGKIVFGRNVSGHYQIWIANYDGSNAVAIPIVLPQDISLIQNVDSKGVKVSPDGKTLFFLAGKIVNNYQEVSVYCCNIDGSNAHLIIQGNDGSTADILEVYQAF